MWYVLVQMSVEEGATTASSSSSLSSYQKAAHVIDVTCGLLFPLIFILFNVAYWLTY